MGGPWGAYHLNRKVVVGDARQQDRFRGAAEASLSGHVHGGG